MGGSLCAKCIQIGTLPASNRSRKFYPIVAGDYAYLGHDEALIRTVNNQDHLVWTYQLGTPIKRLNLWFAGIFFLLTITQETCGVSHQLSEF